MSGILLAHRHAGAKTGIVLPNIGDAWLGGYYAGVIDTIKTAPIASDYYQTRQRHAVILAPVSLQTTGKTYMTSASAAPAQSHTLWNGLDATASMNSASYPAAQYCAGLTKPSGDSASAWYLPAIDELELVYRNLKPTTDANDTGSFTFTFPPYAHSSGVNSSSDPTGAAYTTSVPGQTTVAAFQSGGAQAMSNQWYWSVTEASTTAAWSQWFIAGVPGKETGNAKTNAYAVRPVRRLVLA